MSYPGWDTEDHPPEFRGPSPYQYSGERGYYTDDRGVIRREPNYGFEAALLRSKNRSTRPGKPKRHHPWAHRIGITTLVLVGLGALTVAGYAIWDYNSPDPAPPVSAPSCEDALVAGQAAAVNEDIHNILAPEQVPYGSSGEAILCYWQGELQVIEGCHWVFLPLRLYGSTDANMDHTVRQYSDEVQPDLGLHQAVMRLDPNYEKLSVACGTELLGPITFGG